MTQLRYLLFALFVLLMDQISKWYVMENIIIPGLPGIGREPLGLGAWYMESLSRLPYVQIEVLPFFNWVMVWNHGISFGMFNEQTDYGPLILIVLALIVIVWFVIWLFQSSSKLHSLGIALVIGGALGNVIDRLRFDAVIDFLDFHAFGYHWPAFNVGDAAIVIGVFILIVYTVGFEAKAEEKPV